MPLRQALADAEQLVEQNKDWVKNEFEGKLKELEKKRETMVRDAEETARRAASPSSEPASEADRRGRPDLSRQARADPHAAATRD